jgi:hypothetical protein
MFGSRKISSLKFQVEQLEREKAADVALFLQVLRRELANYLVREDPDRFLKLYERVMDLVSSVEKMDHQALEARFLLISREIPKINGFDYICTREHVLYEDSLKIKSLEDIENDYVTLIRYHALMRSYDPNWRKLPHPPTSQSDCKRRRQNPSVKRPESLVAPEQKCIGR